MRLQLSKIKSSQIGFGLSGASNSPGESHLPAQNNLSAEDRLSLSLIACESLQTDLIEARQKHERETRERERIEEELSVVLGFLANAKVTIAEGSGERERLKHQLGILRKQVTLLEVKCEK